MSESKKKKEEKAGHGGNPNTPLPQLLLDCTKDKYRLVTLATRWAQEVKQRDQVSGTAQELINMALKEILTGQVTPETIEKLPPIVKVDKKLVDIPAKAEKPLDLDKEEKE